MIFYLLTIAICSDKGQMVVFSFTTSTSWLSWYSCIKRRLISLHEKHEWYIYRQPKVRLSWLAVSSMTIYWSYFLSKQWIGECGSYGRKIGRTLFVEGHEALPCTVTTAARGNHAIFIHWSHLPSAGEGFMSSLAAAGYLLFILSAVGRTGINPVPTADVCNTLAINGLSKWLQHSATVGVGFIPTLAAAVYLLQFLSVAGRTGINPRSCGIFTSILARRW